ncbi:MAG TPA: SDR family oxidoreductase [Caldilineaceae bacterium]|nr:SDR family oxidoreductase [Caldilineaceae bacterium]
MSRKQGPGTHRPEVVVITGASAGVGRAVAQAFARQGAHIGLIARGRDGLEGARRDVERLGGRALALPLDVADAGLVEEAAQRVEETFGPIDIWINNAMVSVFSPIKEMTADEFRRVTEVTYLGYVHGTLTALRRMLPRDRGTIVQVSSALAYRGIPLQAAYCGAKHAIQGFTDSLWSELIHDGSNVWVTMVHLPAVNTPQFGWVKSRLPNKAQPVPPIYQPEVAAEAIVWAAHHRRRELTLGGMNALILWGNKFLPGFGDWYLAQTGYDSQQTNEPRDPNRPHNLWEPAPGDHGAHGDFDHLAKDHSWQLWANTHFNELALAALGLLGGATYAWLRARRQPEEPARLPHYPPPDAMRPLPPLAQQPNGHTAYAQGWPSVR